MEPLRDLIKSNSPNFISGIALLFSWLGIVFVIQDLFYASFGFILLAFVFDAFDGYLARSLGLNNKFGRALDGYVDVVNYLVYPAITFFVFFKLTNMISLLAIFVFLAAGVFRLARFEIRGIKKQGNKMYYEGLPVFFNPILILILLVSKQIFNIAQFTLFATASLFIVSLLMIQTFKFPKPKKVLPILAVAIVLSFAFLAKQWFL